MAEIEDFDPDLIAAFIDGRLSGAERERAVRLLAESEAAFEIYSDAVMARGDLKETPVLSLTGHREERRSRRWWIAGVPAAAAAALLIAVFPAVQARRANATLAMHADSIAQPLTSRPQLALALGPTWDEGRWSVNRGGGSTFVDSTVALRLGVRAMDLQVALAVRDRDRASRLAAEMAELLGSVSLGDAARVEYAGLRKRIVDGDSIGEVVTAASAADDYLRDLFVKLPWFGFGKWFAACELAARAHSADFFSSPETERFLEAAIRSGRFARDDVEALRRVAALAKRRVSDNEFEAVRETFAKLIERHAG